MRKKRNIALLVVFITILIGLSTFVIFRVWQDEDSYTVTEKKYLIDNKSNLVSINVLNDANVFGRDGNGVFYEFLKDFETSNGLSLNIITKSVNDDSNGLSLMKSSNLPNDAKLFYMDHYILVGKTYENFSSIVDLSNLVIGYLNKDDAIIKSVLENYSLTLRNFEDKNTMLEALKNGEISQIIVPRLEYLDIVLENLYSINYHFSDMKDYYYMTKSGNMVLDSILSKYYNKWSITEQDKSFDENEYNMFLNKLKITEKELDVIKNKKYKYGFIKNAPYDIKKSSVYGGITSKYIYNFMNMSGMDFEFIEYSNYNKLTKAISKGEIDLFLNYYGLDTNMVPLDTRYNIDISFIMNNNDKRVFSNINSIKNETIYVKENSIIDSYLKSLGLSIKNYKDEKELRKILKENSIIAMDSANYLAYKDENVKVSERFKLNTKLVLIFNSNNDTMFNRLFSYYVSSIDKNEVLYTGLDNYNRTIKFGKLIITIIEGSIVLIVLLAGICYVIYRFSHKAFIKRKIKKNDKIKYIDILTSLKNRNYLSENIPVWNQNTLYPQAIIVINLNSIQELNDIYGYAEGDKQIQSCANSLIKTQLDNTEIMRTDGNEFTIYLVGYSEKQVISYVKKLSKEFKNLPHDRSAAIGFSMIEDDSKLISDAINEATEKMKENKAIALGDKDVEKD